MRHGNAGKKEERWRPQEKAGTRVTPNSFLRILVEPVRSVLRCAVIGLIAAALFGWIVVYVVEGWLR